MLVMALAGLAALALVRLRVAELSR